MDDRVLVFPSDMAVGHLYVSHRGVDSHCAARGRVSVPEGATVWLHADSPLRGLYSLAPDDLYGIGLSKKKGNDGDLRSLGHLTGLKDLYCSKSHHITDAGIAHIAGLRDLVELDLYWTKVSDAALPIIGQMHRLTHLHLGFTKVKGQGLVHLARLQGLVRLSLENTDVDDSAVPVLATLSFLKGLALWGTRFSTRGLAALRKALPNCAISMMDPGRRLADERRQDAVLRILLGRLGWREAPPGAQIVEWREFHGAARAFKRPYPVAADWDTAMCLPRLRSASELRVVTADGRDVWIPWLRKRGGDRRRVTVRGAAASARRRLPTPEGVLTS